MPKNEDNKTVRCSFCGKSKHEVRRMVAGPGVFICDECVELCLEIVNDTVAGGEPLNMDDIPKPAEIMKTLDDYVIGQNKAKKGAGRRGVQSL